MEENYTLTDSNNKKNSSRKMNAKEIKNFSEYTLKNLICKGNTFLESNKRKVFNEQTKVIFDLSWLEKLKIFIFAFTKEEEKKTPKDFYKKKINLNIDEDETKISSLNKKFEYLLKKINNYSTIDFILECEKIEYFLNDFYLGFSNILSKDTARIYIEQNNNSNLFNKLEESFKKNEKLKKNIFEYLVAFFHANMDNEYKIKPNKSNEKENNYYKEKEDKKDDIIKKFYKRIQLFFDVFYDIFLNTKFFQVIIKDKIKIRNNLLCDVIDCINEEGQITKTENKINFSLKKHYDEINIKKEKILKYENTLYKDEFFIVSVSFIFDTK